ncbi:(2Fe-2S)-binding protein [Bordetella tumbae]|uniref:(2Fe-2S)-binding protein n=1 Tax=Bordetella tumbae TaxID=1649139 RepID=UPI0039F121EB
MRIDTSLLTHALFTSTPSDELGTVTLRFDHEVLVVPAGITVAAALLMSGVDHFRTTSISAASRAPYCMMGVCFDCLVEIDGKPSRQACLTLVRDGMIIRRQHGASALPTLQEDVRHGD